MLQSGIPENQKLLLEIDMESILPALMPCISPDSYRSLIINSTTSTSNARIRYTIRHSLALIVFLLIAANGYAQSDSDYAPQLLHQYFLHEARLFAFEVEGRDSAPVLRPEPLLNWQNAERQGQLGSVFVCTHEGRPELIISIFTYRGKSGLRHRHELISMIDSPMKVMHDGERVWRPTAADIAGKETADFGQPDTTPVRRLNQMRTIMRQMEGQLFTEPPSKLNLLPQPLFRYSSESKGILDGAIFAMALGTDPDILILVESRKTPDGTRWFVVPFRSHLLGLELKYRGEMIWKAEAKPDLKTSGPMQMPHAREPFFVFTDATVPPPPEEMAKLVEVKSEK